MKLDEGGYKIEKVKTKKESKAYESPTPAALFALIPKPRGTYFCNKNGGKYQEGVKKKRRESGCGPFAAARERQSCHGLRSQETIYK